MKKNYLAPVVDVDYFGVSDVVVMSTTYFDPEWGTTPDDLTV